MNKNYEGLNEFQVEDHDAPLILNAQPPAYAGNATTTVIIHQPGLQHNGARLWSSGICSCFDDMESCCCALFCPPCFVNRLYHHYGECCCTHCFIPNPVFSLRLQHRNRHKISGTMMNDVCSSTFCYLCVACQLKRDMDYVIATKGTLAM